MSRFLLIVMLAGMACAPLLAVDHDISGAWEFNVETAAGSGSPSFVFTQAGEKLTGTYSGLFGKADLTGTVKGDQIDFKFNLTGKALKLFNPFPTNKLLKRDHNGIRL